MRLKENIKILNKEMKTSSIKSKKRSGRFSPKKTTAGLI